MKEKNPDGVEAFGFWEEVGAAVFLQRVDQILINVLSLGQNQNLVQSKNAVALVVLRLLQMQIEEEKVRKNLIFRM